MKQTEAEIRQSKNRRLAFVLFLVAAGFFAGFMAITAFQG